MASARPSCSSSSWNSTRCFDIEPAATQWAGWAGVAVGAGDVEALDVVVTEAEEDGAELPPVGPIAADGAALPVPCTVVRGVAPEPAQPMTLKTAARTASLETILDTRPTSMPSSPEPARGPTATSGGADRWSV
jgi:hypothetical protein